MEEEKPVAGSRSLPRRREEESARRCSCQGGDTPAAVLRPFGLSQGAHSGSDRVDKRSSCHPCPVRLPRVSGGRGRFPPGAGGWGLNTQGSDGHRRGHTRNQLWVPVPPPSAPAPASPWPEGRRGRVPRTLFQGNEGPRVRSGSLGRPLGRTTLSWPRTTGQWSPRATAQPAAPRRMAPSPQMLNLQTPDLATHRLPGASSWDGVDPRMGPKPQDTASHPCTRLGG